MVTIFRPVLHGWDGAAQYAWLRSALVDMDLNTHNDVHHFEEIQQVDLQSSRWVDDRGYAPSGLWRNQWPVGSAVLWSPFFAIAHLATKVLLAVGGSWPDDGYSPLYTWLTLFGTTVWGLAGVLLLYRIAQRLYGDFTATLATVAVWLASPLVFYQFMYPAMAHANDVFICSLLVWVWIRTRTNRSMCAWTALGLICGLAMMVRTQNAVLIVFPGLELLLACFWAAREGAWPVVRATFLKGTAFATAALLGFLPQMLVWKAVWGSFIVNPFYESARLTSDWTSPNAFNSLFASRGLFTWSPLLLPAILGLLLLARKDRRLSLFLGVNFILQVYVIGSYEAWDGTPGFGARYFLGMLPAFVLGLGALVDWLRRCVPGAVIVLAAGLFVAWNGLLLVQYVLQLVPRGGPISVEQMVRNQFVVVPRYFGEVLDLLRSKAMR
jgi:hypothetical protein